MAKEYYVYILLTENNTFYCGYTDDINKRFDAHKSGKGAKYTRANKPIKIIYQKAFKTKSEAMKEEYRIKQLTKEEKIALINSHPKTDNLLQIIKQTLTLKTLISLIVFTILCLGIFAFINARIRGFSS